jgi:hypothetical protein
MFAVRYYVCRAFYIGTHGLPCVTASAHGKHLPTLTTLFVVRFPKTLCRAYSKGRTAKENLCRAFFRDARQSVFANATTSRLSLLLTEVNLCRAYSQNARQRRIVLSAFYVGARQKCNFAVRFMWAHGKVFLKNVFSYLLLIFPPLIHYFVLYTSIM